MQLDNLLWIEYSIVVIGYFKIFWGGPASGDRPVAVEWGGEKDI
jgi:hypothetical protein